MVRLTVTAEQRWWKACARAREESCGLSATAAELGLLDAADRALTYEDYGVIQTHEFYAVAVAAAMADPRTTHLFAPPPPREENPQ